MSKKTQKKMAPHPSQVFAQSGEGAERDKLDEALGSAFADGYKAGMMRAHRELLANAERCKASNSQLTHVGVSKIAWDLHNLSKDPSL